MSENVVGKVRSLRHLRDHTGELWQDCLNKVHSIKQFVWTVK